MMLTGQLTEERQCSLLMSTCPITATFNVKFNIIQNTSNIKLPVLNLGQTVRQ